MARDIKIPFGPDKTADEGFEPIAAEGADVRDQLDEAQARYDAGAGLGCAGASEGQDVRAAAPTSQAYAGPDAAAAAMPMTPGIAPQVFEPASDGAALPERAVPEEEAEAQGMDEMQMSILALKDSIGQGRELRAREKEREQLQEALAADYEELSDREYILANFDQVVGEQDAIINEHSERRDARKAELSQLTAQLEETTEALERMRDYHGAQLQPIEVDLGQARATADQAKNDERSRKAELNAAESELRRANDSDANTMALARHRQVQAAYDEARERSDAAKSRLAEVQRVYDDARMQVEQAQGPLERQIEDLTQHVEDLKTEISELGEEISAARKRRQYCETVYQYPDETARMRSEVEEAEEVARQMDAENDILRGQLADSKQKSKKAKIAIGIVIAIVVVFLVTLLIVSGR